MFELSTIAPDKLRTWTRAEYDRMVEAGHFEDEKIELLYGALVEMSPQGIGHNNFIRFLTNLLVPLVAGKALVQVQAALAVSDDSEPEPDLAIVADQDYVTDHPQTAFLVIEVSASSLKKDLGLKRQLYAETNIPEYWVVDVDAERIVVHTNPAAGDYTKVREARGAEVLELVALPGVSIRAEQAFSRRR
jgi:Uma2 family endonuclease